MRFRITDVLIMFEIYRGRDDCLYTQQRSKGDNIKILLIETHTGYYTYVLHERVVNPYKKLKGSIMVKRKVFNDMIKCKRSR